MIAAPPLYPGVKENLIELLVAESSVRVGVSGVERGEPVAETESVQPEALQEVTFTE